MSRKNSKLGAQLHTINFQCRVLNYIEKSAVVTCKEQKCYHFSELMTTYRSISAYLPLISIG